MRLALAQINTRVGDLAGNCRLIADRIQKARSLDADVVVFPELAVTGYPPEDLLLSPDFLRATMAALEELVPASRGLTVIVGSAYVNRTLHNAAVVLHNGQIAGVYRKQLLPNYGVFDENRYFHPGHQKLVFSRGEAVLGISICEDIWYPDGPPQAQAARGGANILVNISASPYHVGKGQGRERMLATRAADNLTFVAYCNLVGGQDELVFDGQSLICGPQGQVLARAQQFEEDFLVADLDVREVFRARLADRRHAAPVVCDFESVALPPSTVVKKPLDVAMAERLDRLPEIYRALVLGTHDYVTKNGFVQVVLGLSGGVDSSLTAAIAVDALGASSVVGIAMPTRYSSAHSLTDAEQLARNLGIRYSAIPIDRTFQSFLDSLAPIFEGRQPNLTEENLQPRIRGTMLMALSNKFGWLVLTTGNKSEVSVGYATLYGDTAGGFAVIKDVPKTLVYELSRYRNQVAGYDLIPNNVLVKAPSAELRPDQKDSDSIPEYDTLDLILHAYVEDSASVDDIVARGFPRDVVLKVIRLVDLNEYKRRQSPPGVKITPRAFGKDWRLPITKSLDRRAAGTP